MEDGAERKYGFAKYLHDFLPNATYVGFTGMPVDDTIEVFGLVVDSYTMNESVKDGITVNLVYDGRAQGYFGPSQGKGNRGLLYPVCGRRCNRASD